MIRMLYVYNLRKTLEGFRDHGQDPEEAEVEAREIEKLKKKMGSDFRDNVTLINNDDFQWYAVDYAEDLYGSMDRWPFSSINWEEAASALKLDYKRVEFQGEDWWYQP